MRMEVKLALFCFLTGAITGVCSTVRIRRHEIKHTQVVKCVGQQKIEGLKGPYPTIYWMERPNKEVFGMLFNNAAAIPPNMQLHDISYQDVDENTLHFVKAQIQ